MEDAPLTPKKGRKKKSEVVDKAMNVISEWFEGQHKEENVKKETAWVAPTYSESRPTLLDPDILMANRCVGYVCESHESESYKILRTRILHRTKEQGGVTIMITSAVPGEGKTLTAVNLALTFAKVFNQTVLLVDSDLHEQKVHEYLGFKSSYGLSDYLLNGKSLSELIVWPGVEKLTVISGGKKAMASSELLSSPRMKELVKEMKSRYSDRYVIFDLPPILASADALAFVPEVDYIVMVVKAGSTSLTDVKRALALLPPEKVLGVVLNRADNKDRYADYYAPKKKKSLLSKKSKYLTDKF